MTDLPALLIAAHGTSSPAGSATTAALVAAVAAARPDIDVAICFLDVAAPSLSEALASDRGPTVVVPLLLSTGFHVVEDIPAAALGHVRVRVARHLGPDPLIVDALVDRLTEARAPVAVATTVLVAAGSSNPGAKMDVADTAAQLGPRLGRVVSVLTLGGDVRAGLRALPAPVEVASYLMAEGRFVDTLRAAAEGLATVAEPIGVHPAVVTLVLARYDEVIAG